MESLGWGVAAVLVVFVAGVLIGVYAMSKRPIVNNVTQTVNHTVNTQHGGGAARSVAGVVFPVLAVGGMAIVALAAVSSSTNASQQVTDTAARSIEAQREIVKAMPQPQVIVQPAQPPQVTVNTPAVDLMPLVNVVAVIGLVALAVFVVTDITRGLIRQRRQDRQYAQAQRSTPPTLTHPLFDQAKQNVRQSK
jgi:heme/copper-type cytochrome/quinol oxidase subunit 2